MSGQKTRLVDFNIRISEDTKREIYEMARKRTMSEGKTVSIAKIGRELIGVGLSQFKKKS